MEEIKMLSNTQLMIVFILYGVAWAVIGTVVAMFIDITSYIKRQVKEVYQINEMDFRFISDRVQLGKASYKEASNWINEQIRRGNSILDDLNNK